jgi:hypothetical protein
MTPADYLAFRTALGPASGFQSCQYRLVEFRLGAKDEKMTLPHRHRPDHTAARVRLQQPASPVSADRFGPAVKIRAEWGHSSDVAWSPRLGLGLSDANLAVCLRPPFLVSRFFISVEGDRQSA